MILALAFAAIGGSSGGPDSTSNPTSTVLAPVTAAAPPQGTAQADACTKVLEQLPVVLGKLQPRVVHTRPDSPYVIAWGDPAVVLRCGVDRPADLKAGSAAQFFANGPDTGPYYDVTRAGNANVWTTVDRGPYVSVTVPAEYQGATVVPPLSEAIARALPAVCSTDPNTPDPAKLCTRRP